MTMQGNGCFEQLRVIGSLCDDWNDHGAKAFNTELLVKVRKILECLSREPFVSPLADGSIQLEYEKESGEYLEFTVSESMTHVFMIDSNGHESECVIENSEVEKICQMVDEF